MDNRVVIEARNLSREFKIGGVSVRAVNGVSLTVEQGEFIALVGPSGCGKSTLLTMLGLIEMPSSGELIFEGRSLLGFAESDLQSLRRSRIGFIFQAFNLLSTLSVRENVMLPFILNGITEAQARKRSEELIGKLGLTHRIDAMPGTLSGGEMQRVAIARAVAHRPALILADEPTGNLDSVAGEAVLTLLGGLHQQGTPIIMATHSEAAVARCSRIIRMRDGVIVSE
jgi:putative ABC transport system ATP-binding protein